MKNVTHYRCNISSQEHVIKLLISHSQGFVIPIDFEGGFGGCAKDVMTEIYDFYSRTPTTVFAVTGPTTPTAPIYDINAAMAVTMLSEFASLYSPVTVQARSFHQN